MPIEFADEAVRIINTHTQLVKALENIAARTVDQYSDNSFVLDDVIGVATEALASAKAGG
jgi:hypothetical protein